jgi:ribose 5-phosphate isomerase B
MKEKIYIANDHTGVEMKNAIVKYLKEKGYEVVDLGNNDGQACSYSDEGIAIGEAVAKDQQSLGIAICGTGVGISIAANKVHGIRAGLVYDVETAKLIKEHNNANILATGARKISPQQAVKIVAAFLNSHFEGGRHQERVKTIDEYDGHKN